MDPAVTIFPPPLIVKDEIRMQLRQIDIMGINVTEVTYSSLHDFILKNIKAGCKTPILNVNVNAMNMVATDDDFRRILLSSPLVFADGMGIVLASILQGERLSGRITYADWMSEFARFSAEHGITWYLLGAERGTARLAADNLIKRFADLKIVGCHHGYFEKDGAENELVIEDINRCAPDVLFVCFGMPNQEKWIAKYQERIDATIFLPGGACLDYLSKKTRRCPQWMGDFGLEWLYRLGQEPGRLWRRYVLGNPMFFLRWARYQLLRQRRVR